MLWIRTRTPPPAYYPKRGSADGADSNDTPSGQWQPLRWAGGATGPPVDRQMLTSINQRRPRPRAGYDGRVDLYAGFRRRACGETATGQTRRGDHDDVSERSIEQQYVLYAAATSSTLMELLQHWQPWEPELEWADMAVHVPRLAQAIVELADRGLVKVFLEPRGAGEGGLVPSADVPKVVYDPGSWYSEDETTPHIELIITEAAGLVPLPAGRDRRSP